MEHVILGLLLLKSQTLYELNNAFKQGISLFYSASYGSIQIALKKLAVKELVAYEELLDNGRHKKIYAVLPEGREEFYRWMQGDTPENKLEVTALSKVFFLGLVDRAEDKRAILQELIVKMDEALSGLVTMNGDLAKLEMPDAYRDIFQYQLKTLDYGIGAHRYARDWFERLLNELE